MTPCGAGSMYRLAIAAAALSLSVVMFPTKAHAECPDNATACITRLTTAPEGLRLSAFYLSEVGVTGQFANPVPSTVFGIEVAPSLGALRWHASIAFQNLNGSNGVRIDLLAFGLPLELFKFNDGRGHLELEPILAFPVEVVAAPELYSDVEARIAVNLVMGRLYASATVVGIEARWLAITSYSTVGFGCEWPLRGGLGVQF